MPVELTVWAVVTPPVPYKEWVCPEGGPTYDECDVIYVEAESKRDAVALGVKLMLSDYSYRYCRNQRDEGLCPYDGVYAEGVPADCGPHRVAEMREVGR